MGAEIWMAMIRSFFQEDQAMRTINNNLEDACFNSRRPSKIQSGRGFYAVLLMIALSMGGVIQAADVEWTFGNNSFFSYRLDSFSPTQAQIGAIGAEDPTISLELGKRYAVTVTQYSAHPLEIIAKANSAGEDTVLLSQGGFEGPFEDDPQVAWNDDGAGTVAFTLTLKLYEAMSGPQRNPGYRCFFHSSTMRGNFEVSGAPFADTIPKGGITIELEEVASAMAAPVDMKAFPDGTGRLAVVDQAGEILVLDDGGLLSPAFLDVTNRLVSPLGVSGSHDENDFDERGLLGMAFHPGFADSASPGYRKLYTYTSEPVSGPADFTTDPPPSEVNHQSVIAEWQVDSANPNAVDIATRREVLRIDQPQFNHNAGMLAFGPDEYLYVSLGDGGGGNDTGDGHGVNGNGQNKHTVHGSIVRIDPLHPLTTIDSVDPAAANFAYRVPVSNPFDGTDGLEEIYAYGLRNPFRFSFDPPSGRLIAADVGQGNIEEVDIVVKGGNYGWRLKEGIFAFNPDTGGISSDVSGLPEDTIDPVAQYDHDDGLSVIGGYVYRGESIPELAGKYVFGDFSRSFSPADGRLFYADLATGRIEEFVIGRQDRPLSLYVKGFSRDAAGELYVLASSNLGPYGTGGVVLKIVDLCKQRLAGDVDGDCLVDFADFAVLAQDWLRDAGR